MVSSALATYGDRPRGSMTASTIHASKDDQSITTVRLGPLVTVAKAQDLTKYGWQVHIADADGHQYGPDKFDEILSGSINKALAHGRSQVVRRVRSVNLVKRRAHRAATQPGRDMACAALAIPVALRARDGA